MDRTLTVDIRGFAQPTLTGEACFLVRLCEKCHGDRYVQKDGNGEQVRCSCPNGLRLDRFASLADLRATAR